MATTAEDFLDVASLLPPNTALPAADKMTYLIARLEVSARSRERNNLDYIHVKWEVQSKTIAWLVTTKRNVEVQLHSVFAATLLIFMPSLKHVHRAVAYPCMEYVHMDGISSLVVGFESYNLCMSCKIATLLEVPCSSAHTCMSCLFFEQVSPFTPLELRDVLERVAAGTVSMTAGVGPAVGCLMTTLGTNLIADCIFDFDDPEDVEGCTQEQRLELWGLQVGGLTIILQMAPRSQCGSGSMV